MYGWLRFAATDERVNGLTILALRCLAPPRMSAEQGRAGHLAARYPA